MLIGQNIVWPKLPSYINFPFIIHVLYTAPFVEQLLYIATLVAQRPKTILMVFRDEKLVGKILNYGKIENGYKFLLLTRNAQLVRGGRQQQDFGVGVEL